MEGCFALYHEVEQNAEGPIIHFLTTGQLQQNLRCKIFQVFTRMQMPIFTRLQIKIADFDNVMFLDDDMMRLQ